MFTSSDVLRLRKDSKRPAEDCESESSLDEELRTATETFGGSPFTNASICSINCESNGVEIIESLTLDNTRSVFSLKRIRKVIQINNLLDDVI